jgi:putative transposase
LCVLSYIATSNHIHLLVQDIQKESISKSMQLISGRIAQDYNQRKTRTGAFWEDRYFATAVCNDSHLFKCLVYIDLNMVRAGVVTHPSQWRVSGYNEIQFNDPLRRQKLKKTNIYKKSG